METDIRIMYDIEEWYPPSKTWESCNKRYHDQNALTGLITYWRQNYPETKFRLVEETITTKRVVVE